MTIRADLTYVARQSSMGTARASCREFDDNNLMQECKYADVFKSETPSNFERWQMVGLTAVPMKQDDDQQQQNQQGQQGQQQPVEGTADFNHNQPQGDSSEAVMLYLGGLRSHPVCLVDDRRVRPYGMQPGETAMYAADGSEQMLYINSAGSYLVSLDGKSHGSKGAGTGEQKTRFASLRHVKKDMQSHKIQTAQQGQGQQGPAAATTADAQQGQQQQRYPHEGKEVNTEVRCTADRIEFRAGDKVMGYFEASSQSWNFNGKTVTNNFSEKITNSTPFMDDQVTSRHNLEVGATSPVEGKVLDLSTKVFINPAAQDVEDAVARSALEQRIADLEARIARLER